MSIGYGVVREHQGPGHNVLDEVDVIELRPMAHPLADRLLTGFSTGDLADAERRIAGAGV